MQKILALGFVFIMGVFITAGGILVVENIGWVAGESLYMSFPEVKGLRTGDDLRVDGVQYGKVTSITLQDKYVLVVAKLDEKMELHGDPAEKDGYQILVESFSILGGNMISISRGSSTEEATIDRKIEDDDGEHMVYIGKVRPSALDGLGEIIDENKETFRETLLEVKNTFAKGSETVDSIKAAADEAKKFLETANKAEGTLYKLMESDELYNDIMEIVDQVKVGPGLIHDILYDESLTEDLKNTVTNIDKFFKDGDELVNRLKNANGALWRLIEEPDLYDLAKQTLEGLDESLGRIARSTAWLGADWKSFGKTDSSVSRLFVRYEPPGGDKYFHAGAAFLSYSESNTIVAFKDQAKGKDKTFTVPELYIGYHLDWFADKRITLRAGLIEGAFGGGLDFHWEDWGAIEHRIEFHVDIRDSYSNLVEDDIDENLQGAMLRAYVKTALYPKPDKDAGWFEKVLHSFQLFGGASRITDGDQEMFFGIGFQYEEEDVRTLIGLMSAGT